MDSLDFSKFDRKKKSVMEEIGNGKSKNSKLELQTTRTEHHIFLYIFLAGFQPTNQSAVRTVSS